MGRVVDVWQPYNNLNLHDNNFRVKYKPKRIRFNFSILKLPIGNTMSNKPEVNYDAEHKIWSGKFKRGYFSHNLSVGEIIFHEMRHATTLIAQVAPTPSE